MDEVLREVAEQHYNPRYWHCFAEESFMGSLKIACRTHTGDDMEKRVLKGSLVRPLACVFSNHLYNEGLGLYVGLKEFKAKGYS